MTRIRMACLLAVFPLAVQASPSSAISLLSTDSFAYSATQTGSAQHNTTQRTFAMTAGQTLTVGTCGLAGTAFSGDTYLRLFGPDTLQVVESDDACGGRGSKIVFTAPTAGDYELRAGCFSNESCTGTVVWELVVGAPPPSARGTFPFSTGNTQNAWRYTVNEQVTVPAGETITVGTCGVSGSSVSGDSFLRLYTSGGIEVAFNNEANDCSGSKLSYMSLATDTYWIAAGCYANLFCSGTVAWERGGDFPPTSGTYAFATSTTDNAQIHTVNQDVYIAAGRTITLGTCGLAGSNIVGDSYLRLYDSSGNEVAANDDACNGYGSNLSYTPTISGRYQIRAGCYRDDSCSGTVAWDAP
ncbi:hypothetical protein [Hyalangium minutum]|uniref:Trypsin domain protein n=1 Tax=Hyalangium minutum TaxID=394096 RepID=A0A085WX19_9BACT|nr:hypothetical protein [Hyalangium minutum]KFE72232.1 trypsin domain protein [Hyalangium minutum]